MRLNPIYSIQSIAGEHFIFIKKEQVDMTRVISFNDSAAWLWNQLEHHEFMIDDAVELVTERYDVDAATAISDVEKWLELLRQNNLLEE